MKKIFSILISTIFPFFLNAQSVLITPGAQSINGDSTNQNQLNVYGNGLLVSPKVKLTDMDPANNVHTMSCASINSSNALAGTLKDPSGDADYIGGYDCKFAFNAFNNPLFQAFQIDFESFNTQAVGDTVFVLGSFSKIIAAYSGHNLPSRLIVSDEDITIRFKTNIDLLVGSGFVLTWKTILKDGAATSVQNYTGEGLVYDVSSNSLWSGEHYAIEFANKGDYSSTMGYFNAASGDYSTAMGIGSIARGQASMALGHITEATGVHSTALGSYSKASGSVSTAMGERSEAIGDNSTAMGEHSEAIGDNSTAIGQSTEAIGKASTALGRDTKAIGDYSTALGRDTKSIGDYSTALGFSSEASGNYSIAMGIHAKSSGLYSNAIGTRVSTDVFQGAMVLGDYVGNSGDSLKADAADRLLARFDNGYKLYTNSDLSASAIGLMALHNANSWSSISDSTKKENFIASKGEEVLKSVSQMRIGTWNYKGQNSSQNRHWGVMAQDFHHHFGKDAYGTIGNDTTIATADFDGVSFAAIKALEERTRELQIELDNEKRFSASLELTTEKLELRTEKLKKTTEQHKQTIEELQEQVLSMRAESKSVRAESRTVQAESTALKEDFKELKEMLLKSVAVKEH